MTTNQVISKDMVDDYGNNDDDDEKCSVKSHEDHNAQRSNINVAILKEESATKAGPSLTTAPQSNFNRSRLKSTVGSGDTASKVNHNSPSRQAASLSAKVSISSLDCPSYLFNSQPPSSNVSSYVRNTNSLSSSFTVDEGEQPSQQQRIRKIPSTFLGSFRDSSKSPLPPLEQTLQQQPTIQRPKSRLRDRHSDTTNVTNDVKTIAQSSSKTKVGKSKESATGSSDRQHRRHRDSTNPINIDKDDSVTKKKNVQNATDDDEEDRPTTSTETSLELQAMNTTSEIDNPLGNSVPSRTNTHPRRARSIRSNIRRQSGSSNNNNDSMHSLDLNDVLSSDPSSVVVKSPKATRPPQQQRLRSSRSSGTARNIALSNTSCSATGTNRQYHKSPMRQRLQQNNTAAPSANMHLATADATAAAAVSTITSHPKSPTSGLRGNKKHNMKDMSNSSLTKLSLLQKLQDLSDKTQIDCNSSIAW